MSKIIDIDGVPTKYYKIVPLQKNVAQCSVKRLSLHDYRLMVWQSTLGRPFRIGNTKPVIFLMLLHSTEHYHRYFQGDKCHQNYHSFSAAVIFRFYNTHACFSFTPEHTQLQGIYTATSNSALLALNLVFLNYSKQILQAIYSCTYCQLKYLI